jgi:hypothetical protein
MRVLHSYRGTPVDDLGWNLGRQLIEKRIHVMTTVEIREDAWIRSNSGCISGRARLRVDGGTDNIAARMLVFFSELR